MNKKNIFLQKTVIIFCGMTLMVDVLQSQKVNPKVLEVLRQLGYSNVEVKNGRVYARRGIDHIIIRLSKKGNPDFRLRAHQDLASRTLPSHHHADFSDEKRLIREFWRAFRVQLTEKQS